MRRIGFVVNPIAGMGGRVGLKGTDGKVDRARELGAEPRAPGRALDALAALSDYQTDVELLTYGEPMGDRIARDAGFEPTVCGQPDDSDETTAMDTNAAVESFERAHTDLILFVGGDGTAADVARAVDDGESETPILGVPAGVKVYSSVFAVSPRAAGTVAATFLKTERSEVNDIDEDQYRDGELTTELQALATVPAVEQRQSAKQPGGGTVTTLAAGFADDVRDGVAYVLGPGSTVGAIKDALGFDGSPLGVDVWRNGAVVVRDGSATEIHGVLGAENVVVVSPIGGQGFVFGRGNQQLSPDVLRRCDVTVVASRKKLDAIGTLTFDTGDRELDDEFRGWQRVRIGAFEQRLVELR